MDTQQWRKKEELLHPDNILLEHNTLRIIQYRHAQAKHKIIQTYNNFLHHKQTRDNKFVYLPHKITNLILSTQKCNPDKDKQIDQPTI